MAAAIFHFLWYLKERLQCSLDTQGHPSRRGPQEFETGSLLFFWVSSFLVGEMNV